MLVLDNARYQKCALVQNYAAALNIELLYLLSYSPHLNLIERLWKFVRTECLYSKYYQTFPDFKQVIDNCIRNAHTEHKDELETLFVMMIKVLQVLWIIIPLKFATPISRPAC